MNAYTLAKERYTFEKNEGWTGNVATPEYKDGCLEITTSNSGFTFWSSSTYLANVDVTKLTHIRIRMKTTTTAENPVIKVLWLVCDDGSEQSARNVLITMGSDGWADILIDCTGFNWGSAKTVSKIGFQAHNNSGEETISIDTVQFLNIS